MEARGAPGSEHLLDRRPEALDLQHCQSSPGLFQPVPPQSLAPRQLAAILSVPAQLLAPRRPRRSTVHGGPIEDGVSLKSADIRAYHSLIGPELRRSLFKEARAYLREHENQCAFVLRDSSPFQKFRLAASAVLMGAHVVLRQRKVAAILKEEVEDAKKEFRNSDGVKDEDFEGAADSVDNNPEKGFDDCSDADALLAEFEIMSDSAHIHALPDYKNFQQSARHVISKVHSSIATLVKLHDSASISIADCEKLRAQLHADALKAQELWNNIKDDIERIRKILHPCNDVVVTQESLKTQQTPFRKIIEHSLDSLGIMSQCIEMEKESNTLNGDSMDPHSGNFKMELQAALGGGGYQRLVDWNKSLSELRSKRGQHFEHEEDSQCDVDCSNELDAHLLSFLDECKGPMSDSEVARLKTELVQSRDVRDMQLTEEHATIYRRFMERRVEASSLVPTSVTPSASQELPRLLGSVESTSSNMKLDVAIVGTGSAKSSPFSSPHGQTDNSLVLEAKLPLEDHAREEACDSTLHDLHEYCEDAASFCKSLAPSPASSSSEISASSTQESSHSQRVTLSHRGRCFSVSAQPPHGTSSSMVPKRPAERHSETSVPSMSSIRSFHPSPDAFNLDLELLQSSVEELYSPLHQRTKFVMRGRSLSNSTAYSTHSLSRDEENGSRSSNASSSKPDGNALTSTVMHIEICFGSRVDGPLRSRNKECTNNSVKVAKHHQTEESQISWSTHNR